MNTKELVIVGIDFRGIGGRSLDWARAYFPYGFAGLLLQQTLCLYAISGTTPELHQLYEKDVK